MMGGDFYGGPVDPKDVPKDVQDMMREAQRLRLQMRLALTEDKVDAAKVRSLFEKLHDINGKIGRWRIEEAIKRSASR
jgi:UDP-glucose 6-dehydrogenase